MGDVTKKIGDINLWKQELDKLNSQIRIAQEIEAFLKSKEKPKPTKAEKVQSVDDSVLENRIRREQKLIDAVSKISALPDSADTKLRVIEQQLEKIEQNPTEMSDQEKVGLHLQKVKLAKQRIRNLMSRLINETLKKAKE